MDLNEFGILTEEEKEKVTEWVETARKVHHLTKKEEIKAFVESALQYYRHKKYESEK